ncbi:nucleotide pyrophosphohydrolase [Candidatus Kaiserbacteria bacterium]|nr:MAG: nucleotide pyrophosphohydrolase [Candidatus Kaiserbacteria bacterium]
MTNSDRLENLTERIIQFRDDRDWKQFHDPKNLAISLQLEASEVLELFQWTKDNEIKNGKEEEIADELSDVFYWVIMLAHYYKIDLIGALEKKMYKNEVKYPVEKAKGKADKYTEL